MILLRSRKKVFDAVSGTVKEINSSEIPRAVSFAPVIMLVKNNGPPFGPILPRLE